MLGRPVHRQDDATARPAGVLLPIFQLGRRLHDMGELIPVRRYEDDIPQAITDDYPVRRRAEDPLPRPQNWTGGHQVNDDPTCLSTPCRVPPIPSMLPAMVWQRTRQRPELQLPQVRAPPQQEPPPSEVVAEVQEEATKQATEEATEQRKGNVTHKWSALHEAKGHTDEERLRQRGTKQDQGKRKAGSVKSANVDSPHTFRQRSPSRKRFFFTTVGASLVRVVEEFNKVEETR